ncbi:MAG: phospho-N-acetylmuramoyl-pentapeptide-transferase [Parcubacteria group bacterium]|nr:phospho-N-acetylmuramoyl-pentapeptide-transferase [Parcubacteria group bacterium]
MPLFEIIRILILGSLSFLAALTFTPIFFKLFERYRLGKQIRIDENAPIFSSLHKKKEGTPTMGGILIWFTLIFLLFIFWFLAWLFPETFLVKINFLSRKETYLPLSLLLVGAFLGFIDDWLGIRRIGLKGGGIRMRQKVLLYSIAALIGGLWFFYKLDWDQIHIPFLGDFTIGIWYIPLFIFSVVASGFSLNETDGLDGLAGGVLISAFSALTLIAFSQGRYDLAVFTAVISGALLAFLWFNIPPARFFMGDTGSMSLGITLGVLSMLTNTFFLLPFFGFILVLESSSVIIQIASRLFFKKKVFLSTPIHHHFEAKGWPESRVVMRFWIISAIFTVFGLIIFFLDRHI